MGVLRKLADLIVFSNLFVAFAVGCLTLQTVILLKGNIDLRYPSFVFFATLCLYNFHRAFRMTSRSASEQLERRHMWVKENRFLFYLIFISGIIGLLFNTYLYINLETIIALSPVILISLGYSIPFIPRKTGWLRLRDIPYIKIFLIALVLAWVTVLTPFIYYKAILFSSMYYYEPTLVGVGFAMTARMLFIFAITVPFDIRDVEHDRNNGLKTFPVQFSERHARSMATISLIIFSLVILLYTIKYRIGWYHYMIALIASALITNRVISKATKEKKEYFYTFAIEGMMVLQFALVYLAHQWISA